MSHSPANQPPAPSSLAPLWRVRLLAVAVTVLWSSSWVLIRSGLEEIAAPVTFAGLRYGLAALALAAWVWRPGRTRAHATVTRRDVLALAGLGVVLIAITQGAQFVAIDRQPFAATSLTLAATPLLVAVTARVIGEPLTRRQLVGGVGICLGVYLYFQGDLGATAVGMAAATVALVSNTAAALGGRLYNRSTALPATVVTVVSMSIGAAVLLVAGILVEGVPDVTPRLAGIVAWLALVNTATAFTWWNVCLRRLPATEMAAINTTMAVQIPLLGWVFFGEALGWRESGGLLLVIGAVTLASSRRRAGAVTRR